MKNVEKKIANLHPQQSNRVPFQEELRRLLDVSFKCGEQRASVNKMVLWIQAELGIAPDQAGCVFTLMEQWARYIADLNAGNGRPLLIFTDGEHKLVDVKSFKIREWISGGINPEDVETMWVDLYESEHSTKLGINDMLTGKEVDKIIKTQHEDNTK